MDNIEYNNATVIATTLQKENLRKMIFRSILFISVCCVNYCYSQSNNLSVEQKCLDLFCDKKIYNELNISKKIYFTGQISIDTTYFEESMMYIFNKLDSSFKSVNIPISLPSIDVLKNSCWKIFAKKRKEYKLKVYRNLSTDNFVYVLITVYKHTEGTLIYFLLNKRTNEIKYFKIPYII